MLIFFHFLTNLLKKCYFNFFAKKEEEEKNRILTFFIRSNFWTKNGQIVQYVGLLVLLASCAVSTRKSPLSAKSLPIFHFYASFCSCYMKRKRGPRSLRHYSLSMSKQITSHYGFPIIRKVVLLTKQTVFQFWRENSNLASLKKNFRWDFFM